MHSTQLGVKREEFVHLELSSIFSKQHTHNQSVSSLGTICTLGIFLEKVKIILFGTILKRAEKYARATVTNLRSV